MRASSTERFHLWALAEIIVGAPDGDFALTGRTGPGGLGEIAPNALEIGENAVTAFLTDGLNSLLETGLVGERHTMRL